MGSLHVLNGRGEKRKTETPETTVYYTRESTGERSSTIFTCPKCGKHRLAERFIRATVLVPVNAVVVENYLREDEEEEEPGDACEAKTSKHDQAGMTLIDYSMWDTAYECADCCERVDMEEWWFNRRE
jgi:hypothetical protein